MLPKVTAAGDRLGHSAALRLLVVTVYRAWLSLSLQRGWLWPPRRLLGGFDGKMWAWMSLPCTWPQKSQNTVSHPYPGWPLAPAGWAPALAHHWPPGAAAFPVHLATQLPQVLEVVKRVGSQRPRADPLCFLGCLTPLTLNLPFTPEAVWWPMRERMGDLWLRVGPF